MTLLFQPILALHITAGLIAVAAGLLPIVSRKGSRLHKASGWVFTSLMGVMLICAWVMTVLRFNPYFAALTATATITVFSGVRVLKRKRPDLRRADRARAIDWILTLIVVGVGLWVLALILLGRAGANPAVAAALVYGALTYGGWDLWRFVRPTAWPFFPDLWTYEHLVKMLSAYGAVMSAFSGNFLTFLPTPWSQLWPTLFFQPLALIWILSLALGRRGAASPA